MHRRSHSGQALVVMLAFMAVLTADGVGTAVRADTGPHFLEDSRAYLMG